MGGSILHITVEPLAYDYGEKLSDYALLWYGHRASPSSPLEMEEEEVDVPPPSEEEEDKCVLYPDGYVTDG
jgi:hypothetical protein